MDGFKIVIVLVSLVSGAIILVSSQATQRWQPYDCTKDHRPHPDPEKPNWFQRLIAENWTDEECYPSNTVFRLENCSCLFESAFNSSVNETCQDTFRAASNNSYEYEEYQPAINQWVRSNCHELVDALYYHDNDLMVYNDTTCICDWIPGREELAQVKPSVDCSTIHWIKWDQQPLEDLANNYLEVFSPESRDWPAPVNLGQHEGRQAIHMQKDSIFTWYMSGNEKESIYLTFGLAPDGEKDDEFQTLLSDACMRKITEGFAMHNATFELKYRPSDRSFQVDQWNLTFTCSAGVKQDQWTDVKFAFVNGELPVLSVDGEDCPMEELSNEPNAHLTSIKMNSECWMTIGGSPLASKDDYTGYMDEFKMEAGSDCPDINV